MRRNYGFFKNSRGNLISRDFLLEVSMGLVPGFSTLDILLVDEDQLPNSFLQAIGQPFI